MRNDHACKDYQEGFLPKDSPMRFFKQSFWLFLCLLLLGIGGQLLKVNLSTGYSHRPSETGSSFEGNALAFAVHGLEGSSRGIPG